MAYYLDTSAVVKIVVHEPGSVELRRWVDESTDPLVTSDLARTELLRAVRRARPEAAQLARAVLDSLVVLRLGTGIFEEAARLDPPSLRPLDALHLTAALTLEDDLLGVVTYADRLAEATRLLGYPSLAPGIDQDAVQRSVATALGTELVVDLDTDAGEEQVTRPLEPTERYCVVARTLADPPPVRVRHG